MNRGRRLPIFFLIFTLASIALEAQNAPTKPLTIENLFQPGGLAGRGPETTEWSPDGTKLSFVQRDEKGEKGELWYVDTATGEKKVLVTAAKLAALDPDVNKVKNEREKERQESTSSRSSREDQANDRIDNRKKDDVAWLFIKIA